MSSGTALQASGYHGLLASKGLVENVKHFGGLFTQIAVSDNGYIAIYYPYEPEIQKSAMKGTTFRSEQQERLELLHISQIISFDLECDDQTKVSGGAGGAVAGALIGGLFGFSGAGAVIGSSATSGKIKQNVNDITLVLNTKDFNNSRVEVLLYKRPPKSQLEELRQKANMITYVPYGLRSYFTHNFFTGYSFGKEGQKLLKEVYGVKNNFFLHYEPNVNQIGALESTLTQMLATQQQSEAVTPQISNADELTKFKSLLDSGIITQEEFDVKKKQLLGL